VATTALPIPDSDAITSTRVLLCEGSGDKNFYQELIKVRKLPDFYVTHPRETIDPGGRQGFSSRLRGLKTQHGFDAVTGIIVASDNDRDQKGSLTEVKKLIHDAGFRTPNHPLVTIAGPPAMCIMMIPFAEDGQLETLCLRAIREAWPIQYKCAEQYATCTGISGNWKPAKIERAMLRSLTSHICKEDPNTSLAYHWHDKREIVIPLDHACFTPIADFLAGFDVAITAAS